MDLFDRFNRLANQFGELIDDIADDLRPHVELAEALIERKDYDGALTELAQATSKRREHARALYLTGICYLRRDQPGDRERAKAALELALKAREGYADAHIAMGDALRNGGAFDDAAESYRAALPLLGNAEARGEVERALGDVYLRTGQLDKAVRELRKAASNRPEDPAVQGLLGQALVKTAQRRGEPAGGPTFEAARQCLLRAAKSEHPDAGVLAALGSLLFDAGQVPDAEKALLRALKEQPEQLMALLSLGRLRLLQGDIASAYEQGLRAYAVLRAAAQDSERPLDGVLHAEIQLLLARCHKKSGAPERALAAYEEALGALSDLPDGDAGRLRTQILDEALHLALASSLPDRAAALGKRPGLAETADGLAAQALAAELPMAEAEALLARAQAAGDTVEVRLAAAQLELRKQAPAAAAAQLRRAAALSPSDPRPRERLTELYERERAGLPSDLHDLLLRVHQRLSENAELTAFAPEAGKLLEALDRPLLVTVMGEFNSGKSTFVNALLGEEVAPMGITPTTATINLLKYGAQRGGRVVYRDGLSRAVPWEKVPALLKGLDADEVRRIRVVEVLYPLDVLQRVNVVDTPGLNSIMPEHEATAREFIAQADAVVWLFTVDQAGKASEREALSTIRAAGKKILGVLNKIDRIEGLAGGVSDASPETQSVLASILAHLQAPETGLSGLLETIVPFSGREALLGRREKSSERLARANLPALEQALEERFFAQAQAIKNQAAKARLLALLERARAQAESLLEKNRRAELEQSLRLLQADALIFQRDTIPTERRQLIADADTSNKLAARETLAFVRPRRWPFGDHHAAPADRDFLLNLLEERLGGLCQASRARVVAALGVGEADADLLQLLDEQVYGRYRAFSRGYLRGGRVDDFFVRVLPRLEQLSEAAIGRALERDAATTVEILEAELLVPLRAFGETFFKRRAARCRDALDAEELRRLDLEERVLFPVSALREAAQVAEG